MKIAVIAANGRSGKAFVERALAAGHTVRAGVHNSNPLVAHPHLEVIDCDATHMTDVESLIQGQDAVVSFIGHVKGSPAHVQTDAMRVISTAMQKQAMTRIVSLTGTGVRFPGDHISLVDRFLNVGISIIDPKRIQDGKDHVAVLQQTDLDWTIIRVLKLQNISPKPFSLTANGPTKWVVGREEVAQAVLQVVEEKSFVKAAPIISRSN